MLMADFLEKKKFWMASSQVVFWRATSHFPPGDAIDVCPCRKVEKSGESPCILAENGFIMALIKTPLVQIVIILNFENIHVFCRFLGEFHGKLGKISVRFRSGSVSGFSRFLSIMDFDVTHRCPPMTSDLSWLAVKQSYGVTNKCLGSIKDPHGPVSAICDILALGNPCLWSILSAINHLYDVIDYITIHGDWQCLPDWLLNYFFAKIKGTWYFTIGILTSVPLLHCT